MLGPKAAKKWMQNAAREQATIGATLQEPLSPRMQAARDRIFAKVAAMTDPSKNPCTLLGIDRDASKREVKITYRRMARKLHPDAGGDEEAFKQLHDAYRKVLAAAKA